MTPQDPEHAPAAGRTLSALLEDLAAAPAASGPAVVAPGTVVAGRFQVVRELGRGGFGVVVEARDTVLGRHVALKFLRASRPLEAPAAPALAEAEAISRLSHPNILHIHDRGTGEAGPFLVLELLEGESLARRLERGPVELAEAVRIALGVARGLAHAHVRGVVHRDLKPSNVFLRTDGHVKVLDFGLAHLLGRPHHFDGGTPGWLAPEQLRGGEEDERTDVWALGALLFRMLSGTDPSPAGLHLPAAPDLEALVESMLEQDPERRPRDASHVVEALEPVSHRLAAPPSRRPPPVRLAMALAGLAVAAAVGGIALVRGRHAGSPVTGPEAAAPSIAVLPFVNLSSDREQEYFSDGVTEEILNALTQVSGLRVIGRTSSFAMKGREEEFREVGERLRVGHLLEGSVRKAGNRVRINAKLIEAAGGTHLWSQEFDGDLGDVLAVQEKIATAVVAALRLQLLPPTPAGQRSSSPEAHDQYLQGVALLSRGSNDSYLGALAALRRAVALDPGYAPAWVRLANALYMAADQDPRLDPRAEWPNAVAAAERAIALAPDLADGYLQRAELRGTFLQDWSGARADVERARALSPGAASVLYRYGILGCTLGHAAECVAALRQAASLDPLSTSTFTELSIAYLEAGQPALAEAAAAHALELSPEHARAARTLGFALLLQHRAEEARRAFHRSTNGLYVVMGDAMVEHTLGNGAASQRAVDAMLAWPSAEKASFQLAQVYAWRGEHDRALSWLETAARLHDPGLVYFKLDPFLGRLKGDRRFAAVLRELHLPE